MPKKLTGNEIRDFLLDLFVDDKSAEFTIKTEGKSVKDNFRIIDNKPRAGQTDSGFRIVEFAVFLQGSNNSAPFTWLAPGQAPQIKLVEDLNLPCLVIDEIIIP